MRVKVAWLFVAAVAVIGCNAFDDKAYCIAEKYCSSKKHTLCKYPENTSLNQCAILGGRNVKNGLYPEEKHQIVELHNALRQHVASGRETRGLKGGQPAAREMKLMQWDEELAYIAQRWANQCSALAKMSHDECRVRITGEKVGQNIGKRSGNQDMSVSNIVLAWYNEVVIYDRNYAYRVYGDLNIPTRHMIGHYTQMVWSNSNRIGCGAVRYTYKKYPGLFLVCNYGPAGNFLNQQAYIPK